MTVTIGNSSGTTILQPTLLLGIEWTRTNNNIVHNIIGAAAPSITFVAPSLRTGTFNFLCATEGEAAQLDALHRVPGVLVFVDSEHTYTSMLYVPTGSGRVSLEPETRRLWLYSVDFQEVLGDEEVRAATLRVYGLSGSVVPT